MFKYRLYMNKSRIEKLDRIEMLRKRMEGLLQKRGVPLQQGQDQDSTQALMGGDGSEVLTQISDLLKSRTEMRLQADDYQLLEWYDKQLEELLTDDCILCGTLFIETVDMPFDSPEECVWTL